MESGEQEGESSAQRRERLLALRSAAAAASSSSPSAAPPPPPPAAALDLPGPGLMDPVTPRPPPRFDYYTNPGAAFSSASHKRKSAEPTSTRSPSPAPPYGNYGGNYPPHQHQMAPSPIHYPSPMEPGAPGSTPWRSPMQFENPMSGYGGTPGAPPPWNPHSAFPAQGSYPHSPGFGFRNSNFGQGGSPLDCGPRGGPMAYRPRGSPMNYGPRGNPYSSRGRGRGQNYHGPDSRGRGGRGRFGFQNRSGWQNSKSYYKCMVDDPWQELQPIVGDILIPRDGPKSWLPKSLLAKKHTSDQGQIKSTPGGLCLADLLDLSFNEACDKT